MLGAADAGGAAGRRFAFSYETLAAGAGSYRATGESLPRASLARARAADAILLAAMGLPDVRCPDGTEISPQLELRFELELFAGVRPVRSIPGLPPVLADERRGHLDFVLIRESTEGLFASHGKGVVENDRLRAIRWSSHALAASGCSTSPFVSRASVSGPVRRASSAVSTRQCVCLVRLLSKNFRRTFAGVPRCRHRACVRRCDCRISACSEAGGLIRAAVDRAFVDGSLLPIELGGTAGTRAITEAVLSALAVVTPASAVST